MHPHRVCIAPLLALLVILPAQAGLVGSPVTVTLDSPGGLLSDTQLTPISLTDSFSSLVAGQTITAGDGTPIGNYMNPGLDPSQNEHIIFNDGSVDVRAVAGYVDPGSGNYLTGYASGGQYLFSGFSLPGRQVISAVSLTVPPGEVTNFSAGWLTLLSPTSFSLDLSKMTFVQASSGQSASGADFTISLNFATAPVPEPPVLALLAAGLCALWVGRRRLA